MTKVRCIFVETTVPVRIRPRIETMPVNGHFLSVEENLSDPVHLFRLTLKSPVDLQQDILTCHVEDFGGKSLRTDV